MAESDRKRKREINFSQNEKQLLISIISKYSHVIEDKKTDRTSVEAKNQAWKNIEREFNASSAEGVFRSSEKLKKCFNNKKHDVRIFEAEKRKMQYLETDPKTSVDTEGIKDFYESEKKKVKKDWIDEKKYITQTGMGKLPTKKQDGTEDLMLTIMNKKIVYGLDIHPFDSDNIDNPIQNNENLHLEYVYESDSDADRNDDNNSERCETPEKLQYTENWRSGAGFAAKQVATPSTSVLNRSDKKSECCETPQKLQNTKQNTNWRNGAGFAAKQLATPLASVLNKNQPHSSTEKKNCSRRRPTNFIKTLTSSKFAEKYDTLLDKRLVLVTKQIEDLEEEQNFRRREWKLKLELLQLQIEAIKKS